MKLFKHCAHTCLCIALAAFAVWAISVTAAIVYILVEVASS